MRHYHLIAEVHIIGNTIRSSSSHAGDMGPSKLRCVLSNRHLAVEPSDLITLASSSPIHPRGLLA